MSFWGRTVGLLSLPPPLWYNLFYYCCWSHSGCARLYAVCGSFGPVKQSLYFLITKLWHWSKWFNELLSGFLYIFYCLWHSRYSCCCALQYITVKRYARCTCLSIVIDHCRNWGNLKIFGVYWSVLLLIWVMLWCHMIDVVLSHKLVGGRVWNSFGLMLYMCSTTILFVFQDCWCAFFQGSWSQWILSSSHHHIAATFHIGKWFNNAVL